MNNKRILSLAEKIKDNWSLCEFMAKNGPRACEKETMIAQTICACKINLKEHGKAFSFDKCDRGIYNGGIVDNRTAYNYLFQNGYFKAGKFKSQATIEPTEKLIVELEQFFNK